MAGGFRQGLRNTLLWSHRRGSWQYDVICALIVAFIMLTPRTLFNDRPSATVVREIAAVEEDMRLFWVEPESLRGHPPELVRDQLRDLVRDKSGEQDLQVIGTETARDEAGNIRAYFVHAHQ